MNRKSRWISACLAVAALSAPARAEAYRPFDGTDADVAELKTFELELGPAEYEKIGSRAFLAAPNLVLNLGVVEGTELVVDAEDYLALGAREAGVPLVSLHGDDILVKHVFREGTLQGKTGVSLAAEGGVLLPEVGLGNGVGASLDAILSYQWAFGAIHWNEWFELTRDHHADLFNGLILEGPRAWTVRPVAEVFFEKDFAAESTGSVLLGAIWTAREFFAVDAAVLAARVGDAYAGEARFGFTWAIPIASAH